MSERMFPIMDGDNIPWAMIAPHEGQADRNHGQTLERLAVRGGLSRHEAICVLRGLRWEDPSVAVRDATRILATMVREWKESAMSETTVMMDATLREIAEGMSHSEPHCCIPECLPCVCLALLAEREKSARMEAYYEASEAFWMGDTDEKLSAVRRLHNARTALADPPACVPCGEGRPHTTHYAEEQAPKCGTCHVSHPPHLDCGSAAMGADGK